MITLTMTKDNAINHIDLMLKACETMTDKMKTVKYETVSNHLAELVTNYDFNNVGDIQAIFTTTENLYNMVKAEYLQHIKGGV